MSNQTFSNDIIDNDEDNEEAFQHLDVHDPDSPYGLIQDVLTPSQSISNNVKPDLNSNDLGGLNTNEVLLSEGNLLILKGIKSFLGTYMHF